MEKADGQWFDSMVSDAELQNYNKRKSREGIENSTAMLKDSSELHVQKKVHKVGPTVSEGSNGNARVMEENYCLEEISCNNADTSGVLMENGMEEILANLMNEHYLEETVDSDKTSKFKLSEICSTNKWNCPMYELCKEVGPTHNVRFKYKVTVIINTYSMTILECFGSPNCQREAAQEHAAEGALWYLNHLLLF